MSKKDRYVLVTGHNVPHMTISIARNDNMRHYCAFSCMPISGVRHYYSDAHRIVRARRMALCAVFFVELNLRTNNDHAQPFYSVVNETAQA